MNNENIDNGCILLARRILLSEIWKKPPEYLKIWIYILLKVNHKNKLFERGSNFFNWSDDIKDLSGISKNTVFNCIKWLKQSEQITTSKTTRGMIIKVNNYDTYQTMENYKPKKNPLPAGDEPKETKRFTPPTFEEVEAYCKERNNGIDARRFIDFYESKGWLIGKNKMKDWKAAVRTWENKDKKNKVVPIKNSKNSKKENGDAFYMSLSR